MKKKKTITNRPVSFVVLLFSMIVGFNFNLISVNGTKIIIIVKLYVLITT